jgi:SAM-dependent methyltransferase
VLYIGKGFFLQGILNGFPKKTFRATDQFAQPSLPYGYGDVLSRKASISKVETRIRMASTVNSPYVTAGYRLDARGRQSAEDGRLALLERIFDPRSRHLRKFVRPGWRCLEIGAGRGSMAAWLAERAGERGHVVATDIDLTYLNSLRLPNLEVRQHNILEDSLDALEPGSFDVVCSRLMLFWLAGRQETAIRRMIECLRPGGWLVDEDGDWGTVVPVDTSHPLSASYNDAWRDGEWWRLRGYDPLFGRKLPLLFDRCGLENIGHEATAEVVRGASPWAQWWQQTLEGIDVWEQSGGARPDSRAKEQEALIEPLRDSSFWFSTALVHGCWGQRTK